jgi:hypothetical protein
MSKGFMLEEQNAVLRARVETLTAERDRALALVAEVTKVKDGAYSERNQILAAFARMAVALGWRAGVGRHPADDLSWENDWRTILFIDLPTGQASWHFHDSEAHLLAGLPAYRAPWDGHTTPEKYERLRAALQRAEEVKR